LLATPEYSAALTPLCELVQTRRYRMTPAVMQYPG
jgi:hypothetical protein